ncbi:hypothetical protein Flavo103_06210 [Flavobacterium collinsii]|uniref:SMI1/KNR4 family protein n=1 Tax=Flavobacterium collinsii TaxID=1114861 RepID=UPI0022BBECD2|nr:SMI1/KNR4 family protein [Flavobacterium collinsii]GIQ57485.1 hypothetical protein Flavo103_06210 [Flavobacterium collinsii]
MKSNGGKTKVLYLKKTLANIHIDTFVLSKKNSVMKNILDRIEKLESHNPHIKLYKDFGKDIILKHMGKIIGEIDNQYINFLKFTNGASILDYCFLGLKNNKLGINLYENHAELWLMNYNLSQKYWGCIIDSTGNTFGYLDQRNESGDHYFGYYSIHESEKIYLVASSFKIFMNKFLMQIEETLKNNPEAISLINNNWFTEKMHLIKDDIEMEIFLDSSKSTIYQKK